MNNPKLLWKLFQKAMELYFVAERDQMMYGNSYVEFGDRSIKIIDPQDLIIKVDATNKQLKIFKKKLKQEFKKKGKKK